MFLEIEKLEETDFYFILTILDILDWSPNRYLSVEMSRSSFSETEMSRFFMNLRKLTLINGSQNELSWDIASID